MGAHADQNLFFLKRFRNVVHPTDLETRNNVFLHISGGNKDHGDMLRVGRLLEPATDLIAVHARHRNIEEDQIGHDPAGALEGDVAIRRQKDFVPLEFEEFAQHIQIRRLVVDQEDLGTSIVDVILGHPIELLQIPLPSCKPIVNLAVHHHRWTVPRPRNRSSMSLAAC